ncbi:MAG: hypothetical protein WA741_34360, partial [Candidatus Sulfotelmatobacter sp.]
MTHTTSATPNNAGFAIRGSVRRASGFVLVGMSSKCFGAISPHTPASVTNVSTPRRAGILTA